MKYLFKSFVYNMRQHFPYNQTENVNEKKKRKQERIFMYFSSCMIINLMFCLMYKNEYTTLLYGVQRI